MTNNREKIKSKEHSIRESTLSYDRLLSLFELSQKINQASDLRKLLHNILDSAISNLDAERGMIILNDQSGEHYQTVASDSLSNEDIAFSTSIVKRTLEHKKALMSSDLMEDKMFKDADSVHKLNILSFICVPLVIPGKYEPIGTLYVDQRIYKKDFSDEDRIFFEAIANLAAIAISNVSHVEELLTENIQLRSEVGKKYEFPEMIGQSKMMQKIVHDIKHILNDNSIVLLVGESGSGKEVVAKAIHYNGNRKNKPFLAINCGALPDTLLEAELFGSVRGAFTGAVNKVGLFQAANGGTLFLDEIHHTSEAMQIKLMRVLQERETRRVGGTSTTKVNARFICATNEDLEKAIQERRFRKDFYYRINVVRIDIPPLRERRKDIPILAQHFLEKYSREKGKKIPGFASPAMKVLMSYDWAENNVRELENEIECAVIFAKDGTLIKVSELSDKVQGSTKTISTTAPLFTDEKEEPLTYVQCEANYIRFILAKTAGNKSKAARIMGIPRTTLIGKMRKYAID